MKKIYLVLIISICSLSIILSGCAKQTRTVPKDLKVNAIFNITSQDEEFIFADISVKNSTAYTFSPDEILVRVVQTVDTKESLIMQAFMKEQTSPTDWTFQVKIPKKIFTILKYTDSDRVGLQVRGTFTDKTGVISGLDQSQEINIKELMDKNISSKTIAIGKYFGKPYSITSSFLPILTLKDNNEFKFELGIGMSIEGTYTVDNNKLVLTSSRGAESYVFGIDEHTLIIEKAIPYVKENTKFVLSQ